MKLATAPVEPGSDDSRERFWSYVDRSGDCWNWTLTRLKGGRWYGQVKFAPWRGLVAHRVAWTITNGPIPAGQYVLHRCDNPACVRPDHLFLGTHSENMKDAYAKGRRVPSTPEKYRRVHA